jgi:ACT domain-containing protein
MRVNADLRLKDQPGQLIGALQPISDHDGNIMGVLHSREKVSGGRIAVNVNFEIRTEKGLEMILDDWRKREVDVVRIDHLFETFPLEYVLVGSIEADEMRKITDGLQALEGMESLDVRYSITGQKERTAMISGKVRSRETISKANKLMRERAKKMNLLLIRGFGD